MKLKKIMSILTVGILSLGMLAGCGSEGDQKTSSSKASTESSSSAKSTADTNKDKPKIGIIQYMAHPSLDTIRESMVEQLKTLGYVDGENCEIDYQNASGDQSTANSIVQTFQGDKKDIIIAIATPVAQAAAVAADTTPIIFSAVTDPIEAGLVTAMDKTDKNITGTSDAVMVDSILDLAREFVPDVKKMGFLYCTGEVNSVSNLEKAKAYCKANGIELIESGVSNSSEVQQAAQVLCSKVDALFVPNDNTVATTMAAVSDEAIKAKIPVFTGADSMVGDGGLATNGIEYVDLGKETANMADQVLKGTSPSEIPVKVFKDDLSIFVNEDTAAKLGITIPDSIKNNEKYVVKNSNS